MLVVMAQDISLMPSRSIGVYGGDDDDVCDDDERDETRPVAVVFRGAGHYEALARCDE